MNDNPTSNPLGNFTARTSRGAQSIKPPSSEVTAKQDPAHDEADFKRDLKKATRRKPEAS